jgi:hypothetical protein
MGERRGVDAGAERELVEECRAERGQDQRGVFGGGAGIGGAACLRRSIPPDRVRSFDRALSPRPTCSMAAATDRGTCRGGMSFSSAKYSTNSATVNPG